MSRKLALLIGNSTYGPGLPPLEKPDADIAALAKVLADPAIGGFDEVKPLLDATSATARREVARFFASRSPDDLLLLYFSGHGLRNDRGGLYLAVQDTEAELLSGTAVPAAFISEEMDNCRSRRQILILDCCYSGAFGPGAKGLAVNPATAFKGNGLGRFVLTASDSTQIAWEEVAATSTGGLSVFTRHLVGGLESGEADLDGDGLISVDELYDYVYARVVEENPRQTPGKSASKQQGEIFLARNPAGPRLRPLPAELMQALDHPLATVREGAVRELERFLRGSDAGLAKAACAAAEQARDDDSRRVAKAADEILAAAFPTWVEPLPLKSDEEGSTSSAPIPSVWDSPKVTHASQKKSLRRPAWIARIALGFIALLVIVAILFLETNYVRVHTAKPDPAQTLLTEAKSWPITLADNFDSARISNAFQNMDNNNYNYNYNNNYKGKATTRYGSKYLVTRAERSLGLFRLFVADKRPGEDDFASFPASPTTTAADFYLRVDLRRSERAPGSASAGLIFRAAQEGKPTYAFMIDQNRYCLGVYLGRWLSLQPWTPSAAIRLGQFNSLAVVATGPTLTLFINGLKVGKVSDATFGSGRVGLGVQSIGPVTFDFDNFELRRKP